MSKYINADELIKFCTSMLVETKDDEIIQTHNNAFRRMREHIKSLPAADVVEVVRCKDCKWFADFTDALKILTKYDGQCKKYNRDVVMNKTDYCSYAERRESDAD